MTWLTTIALCVLIAIVILMYLRTIKLYREMEFMDKEVSEMQKNSDEWHKRCNEVEDAMEKGYGIKIRTEIAQKIETEFSKFEMVVIVLGIEKLLKDSKNPQDAEIYVNLFKKANALLGVMEEEG
jgi:predicted Holliday junction resolvase-like endonuclease